MLPSSEQEDFLRSVEPLRPAIRLHCYRMLGSSHDGDDMVQETLLRAWRARDSLDDPGRLSAQETAEALGVGIAAANSALFRARAAIEEKLGGCDPSTVARHAEVDEALLGQYVRAFEEANLDAVLALFHNEMRTTMPPVPLWVAGREANDRFYRRMFGSLRPQQFRHLRIGANGVPALAFYQPVSPGAPHTLSAIQLVTTREGAVVAIDHFMMPEVLPLFGAPHLLPENARFE